MFSGSPHVIRQKGLRGMLERWADHYTADRILQGRIVERAIRLATDDETVFAAQPIERFFISCTN